METFVFALAILLILWPIPAVLQHIRLLVAALRLAYVQAIADRLAGPDFALLVSRSVNAHHTYIKVFPVVVLCLIGSVGLVWCHYLDGSGAIALVSLALSGYAVQMYGFQSFPLWMRNWDITLRMTRDAINLEKIAALMKEVQAEMVILAGTPDSPEAYEQLNILSIMLLELIEKGAAISVDLKAMEAQVSKLPK